MANETNRNFVGRHFRLYVDDLDYIQRAHNKCAPFVTSMVDSVRAIPDIPEKKRIIGSVLDFSRATEKHIANLEFEMTNIEYELSRMYMRNAILEEEVRRCHCKIDATDQITLSLVNVLERKLKC